MAIQSIQNLCSNACPGIPLDPFTSCIDLTRCTGAGLMLSAMVQAVILVPCESSFSNSICTLLTPTESLLH